MDIFVNYENCLVLSLLATKYVSNFDNKISLYISNENDLSVSNYIYNWYNYDNKHLDIIFMCDGKYYILEKTFPSHMMFNTNNKINFCTFYYSDMIDITRKYRIKKLIN